MNRYTVPRLVKGPKPTSFPKGSNLAKEWAKNDWYINYSFNGKQYRVKNNINRYHDAAEKEKYAADTLAAIKQALAEGYNPANPEIYLEKLKADNISLRDAVEEYLQEVGSYLRKRTVESYESKLRYLVEAFPNYAVKDVRTKDLEKYIYDKIHKGEKAVLHVEGKVIQTKKITKWTPATVDCAKTYFTTFFKWCAAKERGYISESPMHGLNERRLRSEVEAPDRHIPFTTEELKSILQHLDEHDKYTALFCRMIYYTCLRPKEIRNLRVADINLTRGTLRVGMDVMKNTKTAEADTVHLDRKFVPHLEALNLSSFSPHYHLFSGDFDRVVGETAVGVNTPYNRLTAALEALHLNGKGHGLYSFKHTSNIQRFNAGWTLVQIMKANRHSSIQMTEKYLKNITRQTEIAELEVPEF